MSGILGNGLTDGKYHKEKIMLRINELLVSVMAVTLLLVAGCKKETPSDASAPVKITVGHVGHDHHLALFVAADNAAEYARISGIELKCVVDKKRYELLDRGRKVADVVIVKVGGGSKMPTALAQNVIELGFGGVAPVLASVDSGAPIKLISPLHYKGDMFVVKPEYPANTWSDFVALARRTDKPIRIGYKNPVAVAKVIFEEALRHENISFGGDLSQRDLKVHLINVKGGGKLNVALGGDLVDGYVGNNPFPSVAVEKGLGKIICDLEELPPGTFRNHPCCCLAAHSQAIQDKAEAIEDLLVLFLLANETINNDQDKAIAAATRWIGTSEAVERMSIPTSGYSMEVSDQWRQTMDQWIKAMNGLQLFRGKLKGLTPEKASVLVYDFSLLQKAQQKLAQRKNEK